MFVTHLQIQSQLKNLILVRFVFIGLLLSALLMSQFWWSFSFNYAALYTVVVVTLSCNLVLFTWYKARHKFDSYDFFYQFLFDIVLLSSLLYFSGGATNPFVSLLLLPVAIGAVVLNKKQLLLISILALVAYSGLLFTLSPHVMHQMDMQQHFIGMWINFLLSALVVVLVVASIARAMRQQSQKISLLREEQMRQEQLVALGTSAAQLAHHLATPLATLSLLQEELVDTSNEDNLVLQQMKTQINLCSKQLDHFRLTTEALKKNKKIRFGVSQLMAQLNKEIQLIFPDMQVQIEQDINAEVAIIADKTLLPALLNLVQNAVQASRENNANVININCNKVDTLVCMQIKDTGKGFSESHLLALGSQMLESKSGLGMGVLLSHATLNRLGAELRLYNHADGGAVAEVVVQAAEDAA